MNYALITQLALLAFLIATLCFVCYCRGLATGRRLGAQSEQAYQHRRNKRAVQTRKPTTTWWASGPESLNRRWN